LFPKELKRAEHELKIGDLARSQVDRIREEYNLQQRLRDGARAMAAAFASGPSMRRKGPAVERVRSGYWDCVHAMSELESRLEAMVGMFDCQIQGTCERCTSFFFFLSFFFIPLFIRVLIFFCIHQFPVGTVDYGYEDDL
jgi:hypothetical protein